MIERIVKKGYTLFVNRATAGGTGAQEVIDASKECKQVALDNMDQIQGQLHKLVPEVAAIQTAPNRADANPPANGRTVGNKTTTTRKKAVKKASKKTQRKTRTNK